VLPSAHELPFGKQFKSRRPKLVEIPGIVPMGVILISTNERNCRIIASHKIVALCIFPRDGVFTGKYGIRSLETYERLSNRSEGSVEGIGWRDQLVGAEQCKLILVTRLAFLNRLNHVT